jgi:hypothetical protein
MIGTVVIRNRIKASGVKRMTLQNTADGQPCAAGSAVALDCLPSILRTRWMKPARRRKQRRNEPTIDIDEEDEYRFHDGLGLLFMADAR